MYQFIIRNNAWLEYTRVIHVCEDFDDAPRDITHHCITEDEETVLRTFAGGIAQAPQQYVLLWILF